MLHILSIFIFTLVGRTGFYVQNEEIKINF